MGEGSKYSRSMSVADPGFPMGGGANSRGGYVSKNLYVKTKESGPVGGARQRRPLDPPLYVVNELFKYTRHQTNNTCPCLPELDCKCTYRVWVIPVSKVLISRYRSVTEFKRIFSPTFLHHKTNTESQTDKGNVFCCKKKKEEEVDYIQYHNWSIFQTLMVFFHATNFKFRSLTCSYIATNSIIYLHDKRKRVCATMQLTAPLVELFLIYNAVSGASQIIWTLRGWLIMWLAVPRCTSQCFALCKCTHCTK